MSDAHDDHGHDEGGHEIDRMPNGRLFNLLFGLSALTLLACIGVIQLFNIQVDALESSRAEQGSFRIAAYLDEMGKTKAGWGKVEIKELDDRNTTTTRWHMPLANARKAVLDDPKLLGALPAPPGWKTADDRAPAAPPKPAPTDGAGMRGMPPGGGAQPSGAQPSGAQPSGDKPAGDAPADKPTGDKPAGDKPAGDAPADKPAGDAPADKPKPPKPAKPKPAKPAGDAPTDKPAGDAPADAPAPQ